MNETRRPITALGLTLLVAACGSSSPSNPEVPSSTAGSAGAPVGGARGGETGAASGASGALGTAGSSGQSGGSADGGAASGFGGNGGVSSPAGSGGSSGSAGAPPAIDGTAYYVSPSGSDTNPGTLSAPFLTISKARDVVRTVNAQMTEDIHVVLRGGTYRLSSAIAFGPQDSGTNGHRIHYESYPGETAVLNGAVKVTGWSPSAGGVYKAQLARTTKLRNLYVNDARAAMTRKVVASKGGSGTYSVTAGQASWAWASGSGSDGAKYSLSDVPAIASNKDDLEIVNGTTWNENIVCVRDVVTTSDNNRALLFQQPYGAIAQLPGWNAGFSVSGTHTIYNAFEFLNGPGQFFFDKTTGTLYYYPRAGEDMATADVEAPVAEKLLDIAGASTTSRVKNLTFQGITFQNTDYGLYTVAGSHGKATVQGATVYIAYGDGNWHNSKYEITDTLPGVINASNADSLEFTGNVVEHSGAEGISLINDVINSKLTGNYVTDIAGSGMTIGHPQHVAIGDGGAHEKYAAGVEGVCKGNTISNNVLYDISSLPGFGGHAGITAFFVDSLAITHNHIQSTAYNGINLGWGWSNFASSTTCKNNQVNNNRLIDTLNRLHDSGAIYTIGQMPGTTINQNYVKGIPPATSGPTYGLHNDEGSAYITENDNVLDISTGVKYTINCEDFGAKHDLTILRTYATVNKMGAKPPNSVIDTPVVVSDNVWPLTQYKACLSSGVQDEFKNLIPAGVLAAADFVLPASVSVAVGAGSIDIRSTGESSNSVWLAPAGSTQFAAGQTMSKASVDATSIAVPAMAGSYKLFVVNAQGAKLSESTALVRVK
ncbi:MAG: right-handed parallel beta-helix repeat-containing protein [Myxococcales bacterium]